MTQLGLYPCLEKASADSTAIRPTVTQRLPPFSARRSCRYSICFLDLVIFSSPRAIILAVQGAVSSMNTAARNTMLALSRSAAHR